MQGILSDSVMTELVLDKLLNRYLLMSLRANLDNNDSVFKAKEVRFYFVEHDYSKVKSSHSRHINLRSSSVNEVYKKDKNHSNESSKLQPNFGFVTPVPNFLPPLQASILKFRNLYVRKKKLHYIFYAQLSTLFKVKLTFYL